MADFITELRERRVLPALGVYVASCWVLVEILDRLVERYALSPYVTDLVFWGLYTLLPAAALVAWSYGRPGKDTATRAQKIGVPINLLVTGALLFVLFGDKNFSREVDATFIEQAVEVPAGDAVAEMAENVARVAVFFYENASGDESLDWLQFAATELLGRDLQQGPQVQVQSPYGNWQNGYYARLKAAGFPNGVGAPASLLREIARDANRRYFVEGRLERDGEALVVVTRLWDAASMRQVVEFEQRGWDIYAMFDEASARLREAMGVPSLDDAGSEDLPLSEIYGESEEALQAYIRGLNRRTFDTDIAGAIAELDQALTADPSFVMALMAKAQMLIEAGNLPGSVPVLESARKLDYRLPEDVRAGLTSMYLRATGQSDRLLDFLRLQAELTGEARWHNQLGLMLMINGEREEARDNFRLAYEKDPLDPSVLLTLSDLERSLGNLDGAIESALRYQEEQPEDMGASIKLGDLYRDSGDFEAAERRYRQASLLDDDAITPLLRLHIIATRQGDDGEARRLLEQALNRSDTPGALTQVHMMASQYESRLGRLDAAIEQLRAAQPHLAQSQPPFVVALTIHVSIATQLMLRGDVDATRAILEEAREIVPQPPMNRFLQPIAATIAYTEGRYDEARAHLDDFDAVLRELNFNGLSFQVPLIAAEIARSEGDYEASARLMAEGIEQMEQSFVAGDLNAYLVPQCYAHLAASQVKLGQLETAENTLASGFGLDPHLPTLWLVQAQLEQARGNDDAAREAVQRTLTVWSDADPAMLDYLSAQALAAELAVGDA